MPVPVPDFRYETHSPQNWTNRVLPGTLPARSPTASDLWDPVTRMTLNTVRLSWWTTGLPANYQESKHGGIFQSRHQAQPVKLGVDKRSLSLLWQKWPNMLPSAYLQKGKGDSKAMQTGSSWLSTDAQGLGPGLEQLLKAASIFSQRFCNQIHNCGKHMESTKRQTSMLQTWPCP